RIQQIADPLTIATKPETELVARFMGDNNIIRGRVTAREGDRLIVENGHVRASVRSSNDPPSIGDEAMVSVRAAAVQLSDGAARALGEQVAAERGRGWVTALWALPGFVWLGFFLIAPLVFIVLVSFWTYSLGAKSGFTSDWTLQNYSRLFHDSTYWHNMLSSF